MHNHRAVAAIERAALEGLGIIAVMWAFLALFGSYIGFVSSTSGSFTGYFGVLVLYTLVRAIFLARKETK